jgi:hypothetical protein
MEFNWRPGIGDPTIGGWITVVLYFVAVILCWQASSASTIALRERRIWRFIALLFIALGVNKQLDLQSALTDLGRIAAFEQGWYDHRRIVQLDFIEAVGAICALTALAMLFVARAASAPCWLAILGTSIVLGFVLIRAASFHHVDVFINETALGLKWNWILEMGGISIVILAALWSHPVRLSFHDLGRR